MILRDLNFGPSSANDANFISFPIPRQANESVGQIYENKIPKHQIASTSLLRFNVFN